VLILVAAWACLRVPAAAAQAKLLDNGSFAGSTAGWTCSSGDTVVTSPVYSGSSYSLAGTPTGSDDAQCSQVGPGLPRIRAQGRHELVHQLGCVERLQLRRHGGALPGHAA